MVWCVIRWYGLGVWFGGMIRGMIRRYDSGVWFVHVEPFSLLKTWTHNKWKGPYKYRHHPSSNRLCHFCHLYSQGHRYQLSIPKNIQLFHTRWEREKTKKYPPTSPQQNISLKYNFQRVGWLPQFRKGNDSWGRETNLVHLHFKPMEMKKGWLINAYAIIPPCIWHLEPWRSRYVTLL